MTKRHRMQALALCAPLILLCGSLCSGLGQEHKQNGPIEDGTIVSVAALQRGRVILCRDCNMQEQLRRKSVRPIASVKRSEPRKNQHGWSLPEAA
jgi:hypothetical protein